MSVALNQQGEIVNVTDADQFPPGKSQFMCGFFACFIARSMAQIGQKPGLNAQQIGAGAEQSYAQYNGDNGPDNMDGMSDEQEYELLRQLGLHYQAIATDINQVKIWVSWGYPVLLALAENSVRDLGLGGANPYPWKPNGNHMVLATGVTGSGNVLVRDSANVTDLYNPATLRPGPRTYSAAALQLVSATVVVPPWRPRPTNTLAPTADLNIPAGWSDDGTSLTAPNGISVVQGFRAYILAHAWNPGDIPLAPEQSANPVELGYQQPDGNNAGARLINMYTELCWTSARGVYPASVGREFWTLLNQQQNMQPLPDAPLTPPTGASTAKIAQAIPLDASTSSALMRDLMAAARLVGDTSTHMQAQLNALHLQAQ